MSERQEYLDKLKAKLDEWDADIDKLEAKSRETQADLQVQYRKQLQEMRETRDDAMRRYREMQDSAGEAWEAFAKGSEKAWHAWLDAFEEGPARVRAGRSDAAARPSSRGGTRGSLRTPRIRRDKARRRGVLGGYSEEALRTVRRLAGARV